MTSTEKRKISRSALISIGLLILVYIVYSILLSGSFRRTASESAKDNNNTFYQTALNDTIHRIDQVYQDSCRKGFWIRNYPGDYFLVNVCKFKMLSAVNTETQIIKQKDSRSCIFIMKNDTVKVELELAH
jgi:hypothetical protein